jgi:hypothetical protein
VVELLIAEGAAKNTHKWMGLSSDSASEAKQQQEAEDAARYASEWDARRDWTPSPADESFGGVVGDGDGDGSEMILPASLLYRSSEGNGETNGLF